MPNEITLGDLKSRLVYDSESGIFTWKLSSGKAKTGKVAGCYSEGRILIGLGGRLYKAHRLAWLYVYGKYPPDMIDHIDGDQANNKISNLRLANNSENGQNRKKARSDSQTGFLGVTLHKPSGLYTAKIKYNGKRHSLGYYKTAEEAHQAYLTRKREKHTFNTL